MFKKLFGGGSKGDSGGGSGSSAGPVNTVDAIQKLDETIEMLGKRVAVLQKKVDDAMGLAKTHTKAGNKRAALMALKNKKMYQDQVDSIENNILRVHEQKIMLENQRTTIETVQALSSGAAASKATMSQMKIDKVDKIFDDINEQNDQMREIQDALGNPIGSQLDDDELLAELEELEGMQLDEELMEPAAIPTKRVEAGLPSVPAGKVQPAKTPEELELEQLQAEMAITRSATSDTALPQLAEVLRFTEDAYAIFVHAHTDMDTSMQAGTLTRTRTHTHTHACTHVRTPTHTHTRTQHTRTCTHVPPRTRMRARPHKGKAFILYPMQWRVCSLRTAFTAVVATNIMGRTAVHHVMLICSPR